MKKLSYKIYFLILNELYSGKKINEINGVEGFCPAKIGHIKSMFIDKNTYNKCKYKSINIKFININQ